MSACNALTAKSRRCRGYAQPNGVCHMHQGFFEPQRFYAFTQKHCDFFSDLYQRDRVIGAMRSPCFQKSPYYMTQMLKDAENQESQWSRGSAAYLYEIYVKAGVVDPYTLPPLWKRYINTKLDVLRYTAPHNRTEPMMMMISNEYFKPFFKDTPIQETVGFVLRHLALEGTWRANIPNGYAITDEMWPFILSAIFISVPAEQFLALNREEIMATLDKAAAHPALHRCRWNTPLRDRVVELLSVHTQIARNIIRTNKAPQKEEIMAAAWHPDRFMDWCLDLEELAGLRESLACMMP